MPWKKNPKPYDFTRASWWANSYFPPASPIPGPDPVTRKAGRAEGNAMGGVGGGCGENEMNEWMTCMDVDDSPWPREWMERSWVSGSPPPPSRIQATDNRCAPPKQSSGLGLAPGRWWPSWRRLASRQAPLVAPRRAFFWPSPWIARQADASRLLRSSCESSNNKRQGWRVTHQPCIPRVLFLPWAFFAYIVDLPASASGSQERLYIHSCGCFPLLRAPRFPPITCSFTKPYL